MPCRVRTRALSNPCPFSRRSVRKVQCRIVRFRLQHRGLQRGLQTQRRVDSLCWCVVLRKSSGAARPTRVRSRALPPSRTLPHTPTPKSYARARYRSLRLVFREPVLLCRLRRCQRRRHVHGLEELCCRTGPQGWHRQHQFQHAVRGLRCGQVQQRQQQGGVRRFPAVRPRQGPGRQQRDIGWHMQHVPGELHQWHDVCESMRRPTRRRRQLPVQRR